VHEDTFCSLMHPWCNRGQVCLVGVIGLVTHTRLELTGLRIESCRCLPGLMATQCWNMLKHAKWVKLPVTFN